jgi:hypothetical protein
MNKRFLVISAVGGVILVGSFVTTQLLLDYFELFPTTASSTIYSPPRVNGRPLDVTPFDWAPDKMPLEKAAEKVASQFCRTRGHAGAATFKWGNDQAGTERFETESSLTTRLCAECTSQFTEIECSK